MPMCAVKNLIKMLFTIPYVDKNERMIFVHSTPTCTLAIARLMSDNVNKIRNVNKVYYN